MGPIPDLGKLGPDDCQHKEKKEGGWVMGGCPKGGYFSDLLGAAGSLLVVLASLFWERGVKKEGGDCVNYKAGENRKRQAHREINCLTSIPIEWGNFQGNHHLNVITSPSAGARK